MNHVTLAVCLLVAAVSPPIFAQRVVPPGETFTLAASEYSVYTTAIELPTNGVWVPERCADDQVVEWHLLPSTDALQKSLGERYQAAVIETRINAGRWKLRSQYWRLRRYAEQHNNRSPESPEQLDQLDDEEESRQDTVALLQQPPWSGENSDEYTDQTEPPYIYYFPNTLFQFEREGSMRVLAKDRVPLGVELKPYVDDGKHWVLYTDGSCLRVEVDRELLAEHDLKLRPLRDAADAKLPSDLVRYTVVVVAKGPAANSQFVVHNLVTNDEHELSWDRAQSSVTDRDGEAAMTLRRARKFTWAPYVQAGSVELATWSGSAIEQRRARGRGRTTNAFSVLGGRAAVQETLQLQDITVTSASDADATVDVARIAGVAVPSHPFGDMLGGQAGGHLALADYVPTDRFMLYVAKPSAILPLLDDGAQFASVAGAGATGNRIDYGLLERYLQKFGMTRNWLETILQSGLISDCVLTTPDLYFIDGTEITLVARLTKPQMVKRTLGLLGLKELGEEPTRLKTTLVDGSAWALRGDLLCISTHTEELNRVLRLIDTQGAGSLGQSEEFRYMLTQVPVTDETRLLTYFSDAFIRRLVGPRVKIGQYRRIQAKAAMERIVSGMLKARLDGVAPQASIETLANLGYVDAQFANSEFEFTAERSVKSSTFGLLSDMHSLHDLPLEKVTTKERDAYKQYVDNYSRFWRQFFDPIAIRLNDVEGGELELTTFILPLIDSSIYNGFKSQLLSHEDKTPLRKPRISPSPVMQLSVNLKEQAWERFSRDFFGIGRQFVGLNPAITEDFGSTLHLAVFDADPVISLGSGDLLSTFSSTNRMFGSGTQMLYVPALLSVLTRPCTVYIETQNPERTTKLLRQAASRFMHQTRNNDFNSNFYQLQDRDAWILQVDIAGLINLRFGIEVNDRYLVMRNIPWSAQDKISGSVNAPLNGAALQLSPRAAMAQRASLAASAADLQRRATMNSIGQLYPLVASHYATAETVESAHRQLYGFTPVHPPGGTWIWQHNGLESSVFGSIVQQRLPSPENNQAQGLLNRIENLQLNMQFEDAGLRSTIRWRYRK